MDVRGTDADLAEVMKLGSEFFHCRMRHPVNDLAPHKDVLPRQRRESAASADRFLTVAKPVLRNCRLLHRGQLPREKVELMSKPLAQ